MLNATTLQTASRSLVADALNFPTSVAFDDTGSIYVAESGLQFDGKKNTGRVLRQEPDGSFTCLKDGLRAPVVGLTWHDDSLFISEGGNPGRISRLSKDGKWTTVLDNLPGGGNYHTNHVAFDNDGWMYFGQGALTNSGIVGPDSLDLSWLKKLDHPHDLPGIDITLNDCNATTGAIGDFPSSQTGPFSAFGTPVTSGQKISGQLPCTAGVMRCRADGSDLELVAWGLRNPYGLCFLNDGRLVAADLGMNDRGSRPIGNGSDCLFVVEPNWWYGWPDFVAGESIIDAKFTPTRGKAPENLLQNHAQLPALKQPEVIFDVHAAPVRLTAAGSESSQWGNSLYVALFGDKRPLTGPAGPKVGRNIVRVELSDWSVHEFNTGTWHRPIDIAINRHDDCMYVLDFGQFEMTSMKAVQSTVSSGQLWKLQLHDSGSR